MKIENPKFQDWEIEARGLMDLIIKYGFSFRVSDLIKIFMEDLEMNRKIPPIRDHSPKRDIERIIKEKVAEAGYINEANYHIGFNEYRSNNPPITGNFVRLEQLPEYMPSEQLAEIAMSSVRSQYEVSGFEEISRSSIIKYLTGIVEGQDIIDIGCGDGRAAEAVADLGARRYTGLDVNMELAKWKVSNLIQQGKLSTDSRTIMTDGLTHLLNVDSNSSVILAILSLDLTIDSSSYRNLIALQGRYDLNIDFTHSKKEAYMADITKRYDKEFAENSFRVTKPGKPFFMWFPEEYWTPLLLGAGFRQDSNKRVYLWKD